MDQTHRVNNTYEAREHALQLIRWHLPVSTHIQTRKHFKVHFLKCTMQQGEQWARRWESVSSNA